MRAITAVACLLFALIAGPASAATYYMAPNGSDNNNGSIGAPWGSYKRAQSALRPGDILYARGGTYPLSAGSGWDWTVSGTAAAPITFKAYPGEKPVFDGRYQYGDFLILSNVAWVVIDGLTITHWNDQYGNGSIIILNNANNITVQNMDFVDNGADQRDHHIYVGGGTPSYLTIRNNNFTRATGGAIHMYHYPNGQHVYIYNNTFKDNYWGVIACDKADDVQIYNNIFYQGLNFPTFGPNAANIQTNCGTYPATNIVIKNNVVYNANSTARGLVATTWASGNITEDHNLWYMPGGKPISWNGNLYSVAEFRNATAHSDHSKETNPQFVDVAGGDFHSNPSSVVTDGGVTLPMVSTDKTGVTRPQGSAYDLGAYEYTQGSPPPPPPPPPPAASALTVSATKATPGSSITVSFDTGGHCSVRDWLGVYHLGAAGNQYQSNWRYLNNSQTPPAQCVLNGQFSMTMPSAPGWYEIRLMFDDALSPAQATSAAIKVVPTSAPYAVVSTVNAPRGSQVQVEVGGGPATANGRDWIGRYAPGGNHSQYQSDWKYLSCTQTPANPPVPTKTCTFTMPSAAGSWQFRFFRNDSVATSDLLATSQTVVVP
jgi:Right handed beta helix region